MMTKLSVNINKAATLRNARNSNNPDIITFALDAEKFGANGITVHPRPDERHIKYSDVYSLKKAITTPFNIEGYPSPEFVNLVCNICPEQVTLVPDRPSQLTSNSGWNTLLYKDFLSPIILLFHSHNIKVSLFVEPTIEMIDGAHALKADRIELYTYQYAHTFPTNPKRAVKPYLESAIYARNLGLDINAGHDLNMLNLSYLHKNIPWLYEVSIGHALICDALYLGLASTIETYKKALIH